MLTVWKYTLYPAHTQDITTHVGATFLAAQVQNGELCLWALLETTAPLESRTIVTVETGQNLNFHKGKELAHISTIRIEASPSYTLHVFEVLH